MTTTGGCLCGKIRYTSPEDPGFSIHCYCRQCQQITGTGHASSFMLGRDSVKIEGQPTHYSLKADSGNDVTSAFCPTCGSPLYKFSSGHADVIFFHAGTLDNPALFKAEKAVWAAEKQPWDTLDPSITTGK